MQHSTREQWLNAAVEKMTPLFIAKGYKIPKLRVSCGWPDRRGTSTTKRTIGQCWAQEASADGVNEIFISPWLGPDVDGEQGVLSTLVHEVVHAVVGLAEKHNKVFGKCARALGLTGKLTSTSAGPELVEYQKGWASELGAYPHAKLDLTKGPTKKQTTRMIKMECQKCGYTARTSKKWLDECGAAHCPKHGEMHYELPEPTDGEEGDE